MSNRANDILLDRKVMIKVPKRIAIHIGATGLPVLTLSEGDDRESFSFMLSKSMAFAISESLKNTANITTASVLEH